MTLERYSGEPLRGQRLAIVWLDSIRVYDDADFLDHADFLGGSPFQVVFERDLIAAMHRQHAAFDRIEFDQFADSVGVSVQRIRQQVDGRPWRPRDEYYRLRYTMPSLGSDIRLERGGADHVLFLSDLNVGVAGNNGIVNTILTNASVMMWDLETKVPTQAERIAVSAPVRMRYLGFSYQVTQENWDTLMDNLAETLIERMHIAVN